LESGRASFKPAWINLKVLIDEVCEIFLTQTKDDRINLLTDVPAEYPDIYGDRDKLKQVFINLVSNAIKYNQKGGHIIITADLTENEHLITVKDDGMGMSPDIVKHLFEKFYRSHNTEDQIQGTGLGLSICKKIIENHNGRVSVKSEPNFGTEFDIWLPYKVH
jgi:signal transduction histidine kinase